jgi:hypothetical protein
MGRDGLQGRMSAPDTLRVFLAIELTPAVRAEN